VAKRKIEYRVIIKPSVERLLAHGKLMVNAEHMADFLGVTRMKVHELTGTDRIPLPIHLGLGKCARWSVFELLEWVESGCPRRVAWIEQRGWSGWARNWDSHWR
jgi:predicted DNA-binding transcriptional regulator AlpA